GLGALLERPRVHRVPHDVFVLVPDSARVRLERHRGGGRADAVRGGARAGRRVAAVHAAEHRALRELYAFTRQLARHWSSLAKLMGEEEAVALRAGAQAADDLLGELAPLTNARGLPTATMVRFASRFAMARPGVPDRALERNQALRFAVLDAQ